MLALQAILMGLAVTLVQIGGLAIDVIRYHAGDTESLPMTPAYVPFSAQWTPLMQVAALAGFLAMVAVVRAALNFIYSLVAATLVPGSTIPKSIVCA